MIVLIKNINKRVKIFLLIKMSSKPLKKRKKILHNYLQNPSASLHSIAKAFESSKTTVYMVLKRYKSSLSIERAKGSGRKSGFKDKKAVINIRRSFKQNYGLSNRAKRYKVSKYFVREVKKLYNFKSYRAIKYPKRSDKQSLTAKTRARKLYDEVLKKFNGCIIMDDETYIKCDFKQLPDPKFYTSIVRGRVSNKFKCKSLDKFGNFSCGKQYTAAVWDLKLLSHCQL